jgi:hypothetical protein
MSLGQALAGFHKRTHNDYMSSKGQKSLIIVLNLSNQQMQCQGMILLGFSSIDPSELSHAKYADMITKTWSIINNIYLLKFHLSSEQILGPTMIKAEALKKVPLKSCN